MEIVSHSVIQEICGNRDQALARMREAVDLKTRSQDLVAESWTLSKAANKGTPFTQNDRTQQQAFKDLFHRLDPVVSFETYRKQLDASIWMHLITVTGMNQLMDRTARDELYRSLCEEVPEVSVENALAMFQGLRADSTLIFQRGLARAFIELDRRFKSHDAFKIGSRIILTNVFDCFGMWNYHSRTFEVLQDVERVFAVLGGKQPDSGDLRQRISEDRGSTFKPCQSVTETRYFRIKTYKNGNAHLWFTQDDLVLKANRVLADYYGVVLPDAVEKDAKPTPQDLQSKSGQLSTELQFYRTPPAAVNLLLRQVGDLLTPGCKVLEPSAGDGAIVRALVQKGASVDAIEVDAGRAAAMVREFGNKVSLPKVTVQCSNFLTQHPRPVYDYVVMNPPFSGTHWMEHVMHAFQFLKPHGQLLAILPATAEISESAKHVAFREWAEQHCGWRRGHLFVEMPAESFLESGTRVSTVILNLRKGSEG